MKWRTTCCQVNGQDVHKLIQTVSGTVNKNQAPSKGRKPLKFTFYYFLKTMLAHFSPLFCFLDNCVRCTICGEIIQFSLPSISSNNLQLYKNLLSMGFVNLMHELQTHKGKKYQLIFSSWGECMQNTSTVQFLKHFLYRRFLSSFLMIKKVFPVPVSILNGYSHGNGSMS